MNKTPHLLVGEKPNQKNETHKDKKSTKQERRKKGRKEGNRTNTTTAAAKDLQPARVPKLAA